MKDYLRKIKFTFLGFTIYDLLHLTLGITILILSYVYKEGDWTVVASQCTTEIVLSLVLVVFILALGRKDIDPEKIKIHFSFACLTATAATLIPISFHFPEIIEFQESLLAQRLDYFFSIMALCLSLVSFLLFMISTLTTHNTKRWLGLTGAGLSLFILILPMQILFYCLNPHLNSVVFVLTIIKECSVIFLGAIGLAALFTRKQH